MKKILKVKTNASTMFVSYEAAEKLARVLDNDLMDCTPDDASWEELDGQHIGNQIIRFI